MSAPAPTAASLRAAVIWAMAAMTGEQLLELVIAAERIVPPNAGSTTHKPGEASIGVTSGRRAQA